MTGNHFLDNLNADDREALLPHLRRTWFPPAAILIEQGGPVDVVVFPVDVQISHLLLQPEGASVESAVVGPEGVTGLLPVLADAPSVWRASVRLEGEGWSLPADQLRDRCRHSATLQHRMVTLGYFYQTQAAYSAACVASHPVMPRVARWLLTAIDLAPSGEIRFTQEEIAALLSVQRTSVVEAFSQFKAARAIRHSRGRIRIVNRDALLQFSCACYRELRNVAEDLGLTPAPNLVRRLGLP